MGGEPLYFALMKITHDLHTVHTKHRFVIARGGASEWTLLRVRLVDRDGVEGWGEAAPNRFYGETTDTAIAAFAKLARNPLIPGSVAVRVTGSAAAVLFVI